MMLNCIRLDYTQHGNYFSNRVINLWNSLPNHVVSASTVGAFKRKSEVTTVYYVNYIPGIFLSFFLILHVLFPCITCV